MQMREESDEREIFEVWLGVNRQRVLTSEILVYLSVFQVELRKNLTTWEYFGHQGGCALTVPFSVPRV